MAGGRASSGGTNDARPLGDWACHGERAYGDLVEATALIGLSYAALRHLASVTRKIELSRQRDNLSWSHHAAVAALPPEIGDDLLDRAAAEGCSHETMRAEARAASRETEMRSRIARLEQDLAKARGEKSRAEAALGWMERSVAGAIGVATRAWAAIDTATAAFFDDDDPDGAAGVHGNAEIKAAKRLLSKLAACGRTVNAIAERIDARLTAHTVPRTQRH